MKTFISLAILALISSENVSALRLVNNYEESGFDTAPDNGENDEDILMRAEQGGVDSMSKMDDGEGDDTVMLMIRKDDK